MVSGRDAPRIAPPGSGGVPNPTPMATLLKVVQATRPRCPGSQRGDGVATALRDARTSSPVAAPPVTRARARPEHEAKGERSPLPTGSPSSGLPSHPSGDYQIEPKPHAVRSRRTGLYQPVSSGEAMERLTFRLPGALGADLRRLARRYDTTPSEAARVILADGVRRELNSK